MKTDLNTLVFRSEFNKETNPTQEAHCGVKPSAWYRGDAIADKDELEDFVRELSYGNISSPVDAAISLMDKMNFA